jgi:ATP adenylyltransferase
VERLWAPWRLQYVSKSGEAPGSCVFCDAQRPGEAAALVVYEGRLAFVILNLFPYNTGHLMVVPRRHVAGLALATAAERGEMMELTCLAERVVTEAYAPHGINVGMNLGRPAGAGIVDHMHVHLVPRWNGDTNFMTTVGEVRVLPEDLEQTAQRLRPLFERLAALPV